MSTDRTRTVIENYITALGNGAAVEELKTYFTPQSTWTLIGDLPTSRTWTGPDEIFDGFLTEMTSRLDLSKGVGQELRTLLADGEHAVAEWTTHATSVDGVAYDNAVVIVFRVTGGRIIEAREYFDTAYAGRVLFGRN